MQVLYHASPHKQLKRIKPKRTVSNNEYIGDFVFATNNRMLAAMYLCVKGFAVLMNADTDPYVVICASRRDYMKRDKGGAIYTVPAVTFRATPQVGLENSEMVSRSAVDVLAKEIYKTSTAALQEAGIALYFVNDSDFQMLVKAKDERKCLSSLPISLVRG